MASEIILDVKEICRVCLQDNLEMELIFESQENPTIAQMLSELTIYKVKRCDSLPHLICFNCSNVVLRAYKLKQQCEQSYRTLMAMANNDDSTSVQQEKCTQTEETSMHPCERCKEIFFSYESLRFHRQNEHKASNIVCRFCSRTFDRIGYLKTHMAVFHPDSGYVSQYQCHICKRQFTRQEHKRNHLKVVHKIMDDDLKTSKDLNEEESINNVETPESKKEIYELLHAEKIGTLSEDEKPLADLMKNTAIASEILEVDELEKPLADLLDTTSTSSETIQDKIMEEFNQLLSHDEEQKQFLLLTVEQYRQQYLSHLKSTLYTCKRNVLNESLLEDVITKETHKESKEIQSQTKNTMEVNLSPPKRNRGRPPKKPPHCKYCDETFNDSKILKQHIEVYHKQAQNFPCKICNQHLSNENDLKKHLSSQHNEEKQLINCDQCSKSFYYASHYKKHKESHENKLHQCPKCEKSFSTKNFLQKHIDKHDKKRFICKECSQDFLTREELNDHVKLEGHDKLLLCPECGLRCKTTNMLTVHIRRHNGEKPFKCKFCSKGFPRMDDLRIHEKYHTGEKSHFCETCGKGFLRKYNLRIHLRVHTGEKPYKCPHCPQAFSQGNDLKAHIRRHTGERFRCEICGAAFLQAYQIRQHRLQEHGIHETPPTQRVKKFTSPEEQEKQIIENTQREQGKIIDLGDSKEEEGATTN